MTLEERIKLHRRMADSYYQAYRNDDVKEGKTYEEWKFADDAIYWSPYFGNNEIELKNHPISVKDAATMEALAYSVEFKDWKPLGFKCWPSDNGFTMQTHFGGHSSEGKFMEFYAYGFVETNENGEIIRWETHVNPDYNDFLDVAIGVHGPFREGPEPYMEAVAKKMKEAGINLPV